MRCSSTTRVAPPLVCLECIGAGSWWCWRITRNPIIDAEVPALNRIHPWNGWGVQLRAVTNRKLPLEGGSRNVRVRNVHKAALSFSSRRAATNFQISNGELGDAAVSLARARVVVGQYRTTWSHRRAYRGRRKVKTTFPLRYVKCKTFSLPFTVGIGTFEVRPGNFCDDAKASPPAPDRQLTGVSYESTRTVFAHYSI